MNLATQKIVDWLCDKVWTKIDPQDQILGIQLDITNACNLRCVHCYCPHHRNEGALTLNQWLEVLDQYESLLEKFRMKPSLVICGGEPLACPFLLPLLLNIRERFPKCDLTLLSNGILITHEIANKFHELGVHLQVSMDGPDANKHDLIRGKGSFEKTINGCRILYDGGVSFHHLAVLSRRTANWIEDFFDLPRLTGAEAMNFVRIIIEGQAKNLHDNGEDGPLKGLGLKSAFERILNCSRKTGVATSTNNALWHLIEAGLGAPNNMVSGMVIGYRGEFKVSSRTSMVLGNVFAEGMEKLFCEHPIMKRLRTNSIEGCGKCEHFMKCRGDRNSSYAEYGHFFGPDPGCWILQENRSNMDEIFENRNN